jgi:tRNA1(Val) A37 N6-methylase TrmN6
MAALAGNEGWRIRHRLRVARKKGEEPFRNLMVLKRASCEMSEDSVHIRETDGAYGERFAAWLKPFYLNL